MLIYRSTTEAFHGNNKSPCSFRWSYILSIWIDIDTLLIDESECQSESSRWSCAKSNIVVKFTDGLGTVFIISWYFTNTYKHEWRNSYERLDKVFFRFSFFSSYFFYFFYWRMVSFYCSTDPWIKRKHVYTRNLPKQKTSLNWTLNKIKTCLNQTLNKVPKLNHEENRNLVYTEPWRKLVSTEPWINLTPV